MLKLFNFNYLLKQSAFIIPLLRVNDAWVAYDCNKIIDKALNNSKHI